MTTSFISLPSIAHPALTRARSALGISTFRRTVSSFRPLTKLSRSAAVSVLFELGRRPQLLAGCCDIQSLLGALAVVIKDGGDLRRPGANFVRGGAVRLGFECGHTSARGFCIFLPVANGHLEYRKGPLPQLFQDLVSKRGVQD